MDACKTVSFSEIKEIMKQAENLFDIVRLVDAANAEVIQVVGDKLVTSQKKPCFDVWEKDKRCENCISLKVCKQRYKMTKFEFRNNDVYSVLSVPFILSDDDSGKVYAMELVNKITNNMFMHTYGRGKIIDEVAKINHKIYEDSLTGAFNRRYFDEGIYIYDMMDSFSKSIGFILADVKKFKAINDNYGHVVGDQVLRTITDTLKDNISVNDCIIRMGGDEFLVIIKDISEKDTNIMKDKFKKIIKDCKMLGNEVKAEINVGVAYSSNFSGGIEEVTRMYDIADKNMYADKHKK